MRTVAVALTLAVLVAGSARPARAQFSFDARRIGMGGVSLTRDGNLRRYNPAYRAVKDRPGSSGNAKLTIPIPLGLIQFFKDHPISQLGDDPMFNPDSAAFNPVELVNLVFNLPIFLEVKKAPTPTNDVEFTIGRNAFAIDMGAAQVLIPEGEFGLGGTSRLLDIGTPSIKGFRFAVQGFENHDIAFLLGDSLRAFLKEGDSARTNTTYNLLGDAIVQAGVAPTLSFSGRVTGVGSDNDDGLYLGGALRSYYGITYYRADGSGGFTTGDTLFAGSNPVSPQLEALTYRDNGTTRSFGRGLGGDVGLVMISGPLEVGVGVNDIGAKLTWKDTRVDSTYFDNVGDSLVTTTVRNNVETTTELPISFIANAAIRMGTGTTIGGDVVNTGRGTVIHIGGEQRIGMLALRGGVSRDQRKKMQFGFGGGLRLGPLGLDVGFWTHSNSFADKRSITMATSISLY